MDQPVELTQEHKVEVSGIGPPAPGRYVMLPGEAHISISPPPVNLPIEEIQVTVVSYPAGVLTAQGWARLAGTDEYSVGVKVRIAGHLVSLVLIDPNDVET